jgi:hypothetical protein
MSGTCACKAEPAGVEVDPRPAQERTREPEATVCGAAVPHGQPNQVAGQVCNGFCW